MFTEHLVKLPDDAMEWLLALVLGNSIPYLRLYALCSHFYISSDNKYLINEGAVYSMHAQKHNS